MNNRTKYYLQIADNALFLSHRLSEECSKGPFLEEDLANSNVALDLIGQAESIYIKLAQENNCTSDSYAYGRTENQFLNCILVEQENENFAHLIVRQFFLDCFNYYLYTSLCTSKDTFLADFSIKSLKEVTYHLRRSSEWMIRLGDGTQIANEKLNEAFLNLWKYTSELFCPSEADDALFLSGIAPNLEDIKALWFNKVKEICFFSKISMPENPKNIFKGKQGIHSEKMGHILTEMHFLTNKYPDAIW